MGGIGRSRSRAWTCAAALFLALSLAGCKTCDLVEAELRYQTNRVDTLENELLLKSAEIATLEGTVAELRAHIEKISKAPGAADGPTTETSYKRHGLARVRLGNLTGGRDLDNDGRADALEVVIEPHDYDDDVFKCPGVAAIELIQVETTGLKRSIGKWDADEQALRDGWRSTLLGQGYQLVLPWQEQPANGPMRVVVRFTTEGGRQFEAERDFTLSSKPAPLFPSASDAEPRAIPGLRADDPPPVPPCRVERARLGMPVPVDPGPAAGASKDAADPPIADAASAADDISGDEVLGSNNDAGSAEPIANLIPLDNETLEPVAAWSPTEAAAGHWADVPVMPAPVSMPPETTRGHRRRAPARAISSFGSPPAPILFHDFGPARRSGSRGQELEEMLATPPEQGTQPR